MIYEKASIGNVISCSGKEAKRFCFALHTDYIIHSIGGMRVALFNTTGDVQRNLVVEEVDSPATISNSCIDYGSGGLPKRYVTQQNVRPATVLIQQPELNNNNIYFTGRDSSLLHHLLFAICCITACYRPV